MKKYVLVINTLTYGGAEAQALIFARILKKSQTGHPIIIALFSGGPLSELLYKEQIEYHIYDFDLKKIWKRWPYKLFELYKLSNRIKHTSPNILISFTYYPNVLINASMMFLPGIKNYWYQVGKEWSMPITYLQKLAHRFSFHFLANSYDVKDYLEERLNIPSNKISVINNVYFERSKVEISALPAFDIPTVTSENFIIVLASNYFNVKNQETAIKAVNILKHNYPHIKLVLAGYAPEPNYLNSLKALVIDLELYNHIIFLKSVENIFSLLKVANVGLFTSILKHTEGAPTIIMEYMAAGLPIIVSDIPCNREILGNIEEHSFYSPENEFDLSNKIEVFINNADLLSSLGEKNLIRARQLFTPDFLESQLKNIGII